MVSVPTFFPGLPDLPAMAALRARRQWVSWRYEERNGRLTKPPVNAHNGRGASHSDRATWSTYDEALACTQARHLPGVGFVISEDDGLTGADLDKCRDPATGAIEPWAKSILALAETYAEVSPSGTGVRLIWQGKIDRTVKCDPAHVEIYHALRYLTITGQHIAGTPVEIMPAPETERALVGRVEAYKGERDGILANSAANVPDLHSSNGHDNSEQEVAAHADRFRAVNDAGLAKLDNWVPELFPRAKYQRATGAWRVSSKDLGRDLEEDLSLAPEGIVDFGVADMGDARAGKRSPIDVVMEYSGRSLLDAAEWLGTKVGVDLYVNDPVAATSQRNLAKRKGGDASVPEANSRRYSKTETSPVVSSTSLAAGEYEELEKGPALDTSVLEDFRYNGSPYEPKAMPGVLGRIAAHILDTALYPVPDFACLASVVLCSALYGRRWSEPIAGGGLNIYAMTTAPTGWGKDHPLQEPNNIAYRAEMMNLMGPGEFKSDAAIERILRKGPVRACFMDEIGIVLQCNISRSAPSWERRVRKALLEVYSKSKSMWTGSQAAGDDSDKGAEPVHRPVLSIYGTSTPEELYKGLTEDNVRDGLFGRLIFAAPDEKPSRQKPGMGDYDGIHDMVDVVRNYIPDSVQERARGLYHSNMRSALMAPITIPTQASSDAVAALETISDWQRDLNETAYDLARIANRAGENCGKLATIRSLSRDHERPLVEYEDVCWAWSIVERSLFVITRDIQKHMIGSESEGLMKALKHYIDEAGKEGVTLSKLYARHGISKFSPRDREAAIRELEVTGVVARVGNIRGGRVKLARN